MDTPAQIQHPVLQQAHTRAIDLPANTVQVWPGGATFTTINDALSSIQGATAQEQYQVIIGPGTYNEVVWLKDNVFISGAGQDKTTISAAIGPNAGGVLFSVGNCGAGMLTVSATPLSGTPFCNALFLVLDGTTFSGEGLTLNCNDGGAANTVITAVSNAGGGGQCSVTLSNSILNATATGSGSTAFGMQIVSAGCSANVELSTITANNPTGVGVITSNQATAVIEDTTVTGAQYSLSNDDQQSPITATGCTLNGPVTPGVTVNP